MEPPACASLPFRVLDLLDAARQNMRGRKASRGSQYPEKLSTGGDRSRWDEELGRARNLPFSRKSQSRQGKFQGLKKVLEPLSIDAVDGILLDLGVSTEQLENRERGFSFRWDAPLDMRMDQEAKVTARELLRDLSAEEIASILREYGEERRARPIARNIVRRRDSERVTTTAELVEVIRSPFAPAPASIRPPAPSGSPPAVTTDRSRIFSPSAGLLARSRLSVISYRSLGSIVVSSGSGLPSPARRFGF
jgi:hypothetical protein